MWKRNLLSEVTMTSYVRIVLKQQSLLGERARDQFPYELFLNLLDALVCIKFLVSCAVIAFVFSPIQCMSLSLLGHQWLVIFQRPHGLNPYNF